MNLSRWQRTQCRRLLPQGLLIPLVVVAGIIALVLTVSPAEAISLDPNCTPSEVTSGELVGCDLTVRFNEDEFVPIQSFDVVVSRDSETILHLRFDPNGDVLEEIVGTAAIGKPTTDPAVSVGPRVIDFERTNYDFGPGPGYGYGVGREFLDSINYTIQIDTTGFDEGRHDIEFTLNTEQLRRAWYPPRSISRSSLLL